MSAVNYVVGDVFERLAELPDNSVDLVLTSPPFLALRSYLPADHPDKHKEIGSEPTPAEFLDTLLAPTAECGRVVAPHGSICVELGDTYSGSGGAGGDYSPGGLRAGQGKFEGSNSKRGKVLDHDSGRRTPGPGWPLDKSLCGIPHLYHLSLAYGRNLLTGEPSPAGQWRVRNVVAWCRPNPPVGALGDKFRPATSYMTIATRARDRWFDLDAVRGEPVEPKVVRVGEASASRGVSGGDSGNPDKERMSANPAGAPPLDWWNVSTEPYSGSHYATWPRKLLDRPILSMCPQKVCTVCGEPSRRIAETVNAMPRTGERHNKSERRANYDETNSWAKAAGVAHTIRETLGWSDCGHDAWRRGRVLDPFGGSGTTGVVAAHHGRDAILIDLDERNVDLARERIGMFLTEGWPAGLGDHTPRDEHWCADHCPDCQQEEP